MNYYNEFDPRAAAWLEELIAKNLIAPGHVDPRSIKDVTPADLRGYVQCHFFAGIGGWSRALRLAGWPDDEPVWTGSCPCQPFSAAGDRRGVFDDRHLWPVWAPLIGKCRPPVIFGEQVASKDADTWIDLVQDDLEAMGYAVGAIPFPSAGVGAPHIRDRLYWVGDANHARPQGHAGDDCPAGREGSSGSTAAAGVSGGVAHADGGHSCAEREQRGGEQRQQPPDGGAEQCERPGPTNGYWRAADWLLCRDGKWRPVEPGTFPLAHGVSARMGRLRGYGNAINVEAAKAFIESYLEG